MNDFQPNQDICLVPYYPALITQPMKLPFRGIAMQKRLFIL